MKEEELKKVEKYQMLREEIRCIWQVNKVTVIPVVVGALESFRTYLRDIVRSWMQRSQWK